MTQEATVTKVLANGMAEVAVTRGTACGGNCGSCESCMFQSEIKTVARNLIKATPGQRVVIESSSKKVFKAVAMVYIMPLVLMLAAYAAAAAAGLGEGLCVLMSFLGLILGGALLVFTQRRVKNEDRISFDIIAKI